MERLPLKYKIWGDYKIYENGSIQRIKTKNLLKFSISKKGYYYTRFKIGKEWKTKSVHRIICLIWNGNPPNDDKYYEVDHIDFNRLNNHKDNLRWLTKSENNQKTWDAGHKDNKGIKNGRCKLKEEDVHEICLYLEQKCRVCDIRDFGFTEGVVYSIKSKINWGWLTKTYKW